MLLLGDYAESPKGLKVGDRVKVDVAAEQLEELQRQRDAWDPELAKVISALNKQVNLYCGAKIFNLPATPDMFFSRENYCQYVPPGQG